MFAGLRPLVKGKTKKTAALSRDHLITVSASGLLTITGGKWTTYRKMAEDTVNIAVEQSGLKCDPCSTKELMLVGHDQPAPPAAISQLSHEELKAVIKKAVQEEMCMTVEDLLSRRTRQLLLDAAEAIKAAPLVAKLMEAEMNKVEDWIKEQINNFNAIAVNYKP